VSAQLLIDMMQMVSERLLAGVERLCYLLLALIMVKPVPLAPPTRTNPPTVRKGSRVAFGPYRGRVTTAGCAHDVQVLPSR
jgi:hypothetical protein